MPLNEVKPLSAEWYACIAKEWEDYSHELEACISKSYDRENSYHGMLQRAHMTIIFQTIVIVSLLVGLGLWSF